MAGFRIRFDILRLLVYCKLDGPPLKKICLINLIIIRSLKMNIV